MLKQTGDIAPDFNLPVTPHGDLRLSDLQPAKVVLFFYPKDDTPGCTLEGRDFSALGPQFAATNTKVIGISRDDLQSHQAFCAKYDMNLILAADTDEVACRAFGVLMKKEAGDQTVMAIDRTTFLVGSDGRIARVWNPVDVNGHAAEVLAAAQAL